MDLCILHKSVNRNFKSEWSYIELVFINTSTEGFITLKNLTVNAAAN